jgi:hypothetical protein
MPIRIAPGIVLALSLAACGSEEPETPCCAIEPQHQCRNDLVSAGVTPAEIELLLSNVENICPSAQISEARIRELAPIWVESEACRTAGGYGRLRALEGGLCSIRSGFDQPFVPDGVSPQAVTDCATGLVGRGITEAEFNIVMREPAAICPNTGVSEDRLREIITRDWPAAGCTQLTQEQMLAALNSGACGGDAG